MAPPVPPDPQPPADRLGRAVQLSLAFRRAQRTDQAAFLAEHAELRELIEPMIDGTPIAADGDLDGSLGGDLGGTDAAATAASAARLPWPIGSVVHGYRIDGLLGTGGMGTVLLATQLALGRTVALKVLRDRDHFDDRSERALWRFQREARLLAELDHPGIVKVHETAAHDGMPFYAMEFVDGASLQQVFTALARSGMRGASSRTLAAAIRGALGTDPEPPRAGGTTTDYPVAIAELGAQLAEALACAHAAGIVHRDLKPGNVLLRRDGRALLADFGIARRSGGHRLTLTGDVAGTPHYMSPEQARGEAVDHRSDLFSLGTLLYEALTLQRPFDGETTLVVLARLQRDEPVDPRTRNPAISADLAAVVLQALAKAPHERYQQAGTLAADLRAAARGETVSARPPRWHQRLRRWIRREPWQATAAGIALLALTGGVVGGAWFTRTVQAEGRRTASALEEVHRLAIGVRLDRAEASATAFRVARPELASAMEQWLQQTGEPLAAELPRMQQLLDAVRQRAAPWDAEAAARDRGAHPAAATATQVEHELATLDSARAELTAEQRDQRRSMLQQAQQQLAATMAARRSWHFVDAPTQFLHDQLTALVDRLHAFARAPRGSLARVREQLAWTRTSERRCRLEAAVAWQDAARRVAADARFVGLSLQPQRDLLPIGADPVSGLCEFVHLRSGAADREVPARAADGRLVPSAESGLVFVLVPGGTTRIGAQAAAPDAPHHDPQAHAYEQPVHEVVLRPFLLGKHELTQAQWQRLTGGDRPSLYGEPLRDTPVGPRNPVESVSWRRAREVLHDQGLELPTEAQWEHACRAGSAAPWYFGGREHAAVHANFADRAAQQAGANWRLEADLHDGFIVHAPVGSLRANAFGLHDMLGNVMELTLDRALGYDRPTSGDAGRRELRFDDPSPVMFRGGSYMHALTDLRCSNRSNSESPDYAASSLGVRAARALDP